MLFTGITAISGGAFLFEHLIENFLVRNKQKLGEYFNYFFGFDPWGYTVIEKPEEIQYLYDTCFHLTIVFSEDERAVQYFAKGVMKENYFLS